MEDEAASAEERLHAERFDRLAEECRRLPLPVAEVSGQASTRLDVTSVHLGLAAAHPDEPRYADKAEHARRSAENAEAFAATERKVGDLGPGRGA